MCWEIKSWGGGGRGVEYRVEGGEEEVVSLLEVEEVCFFFGFC